MTRTMLMPCQLPIPQPPNYCLWDGLVTAIQNECFYLFVWVYLEQGFIARRIRGESSEAGLPDTLRSFIEALPFFPPRQVQEPSLSFFRAHFVHPVEEEKRGGLQ
jgi:hypothetical protein